MVQDNGLPSAGDVVYVARAASVQFGANPFPFRVARVLPWSTYAGWCWLEGYQLNQYGDAVTQRRIFVQTAGLVEHDGTFSERPPRRVRGRRQET